MKYLFRTKEHLRKHTVCVIIFVSVGVCGWLEKSQGQLVAPSCTRMQDAAGWLAPDQTLWNATLFTSPSTAIKGLEGGPNLSLSPAAEQTQVPSLPPSFECLEADSRFSMWFCETLNLDKFIAPKGPSQQSLKGDCSDHYHWNSNKPTEGLISYSNVIGESISH